jgi:hypothetical protein
MLIVEHDYSDAVRVIARSCNSGQFYAQNSPCTAHYGAETLAWEQADIIRWVLLALPLIFGVLLGAPLFAGEFEHKTVLLAFTQGVSRTRWMVIRWLVIGLAVVTLASASAVVANWWYLHDPTNGSSFGSRIQPGQFDVTGMVPVAYALFVFALGAALGILLRRTARAIFGTIVLFVAARVLFEHYVRRHLATPSFSPAINGQSAFVYSAKSWYVGMSYRLVPGSRHSASQAFINHVVNLCNRSPGANWGGCLIQHGVQVGTLFQPSSHFWILQWGEAGAFAGAALVLFGVALWSLRRWRA